MTFLSRNITLQKIVIVSQAEMLSPTPGMIEDYSALYVLNQRPFTRYVSNGTNLVAASSADSLTALTGQVSTLSATVTTQQDTLDTLTSVSSIKPAAQVSLASGLDLQTYVSQLEVRLTTLGSVAPVNTVAPTAPTGTTTVGSTLTAVTGTWTGVSTYNYVWYRTVVGVFTATGGTGSTYVLTSADTGFKMAVSIAGVSASPASIAATPVMSAIMAGTVTATVPTNSIAPTLTPSGSQPVPTTYSIASLGTWANDASATVSYQWLLNDLDISGATSSTYVSVAGQEGKTIKVNVRKTTTQGASLWYTSSNSSTVSGSPVMSNTAAPILAATVQIGVAGAITNSTWNQTPDVTRITRIYIDSATTPYAQISGATATYTPEADGNAFLLTATGLSSLTGHTVYCDQVVTYLGVQYTSPKSAGKVVQAAATALAAVQSVTGIVWTQNSAVASQRPVTATGGTGAYTYSISPSLPAGLTYNTSTGFFSGTPTVTDPQDTYTVTVSDGVATPVTNTFTAQVNSAGIATLGSIHADTPFSQMDGYVQMLGTSYTLSTVNESTGIVQTAGTGYLGSTKSQITIAGTSTWMRFGKVADPVTPSRTVIACAAQYQDAPTFGHSARVEMGLSNAPVNQEGTTYWYALETYMPSSRYNEGNGVILQTHVNDPNGPATGPFTLGFLAGIFPNNGVGIDLYRYPIGGPNNEYYPWITDNEGFGGNSVTLNQSMTAARLCDFIQSTYTNRWHKWVFKYKGSKGTGTAGLLQAWLNGTQVLDLTGIAIGVADTTAGSYPTDYVKFGYDVDSGATTVGSYMLVRSGHLVQDNGSYTEPQIRALLT